MHARLGLIAIHVSFVTTTKVVIKKHFFEKFQYYSVSTSALSQRHLSFECVMEDEGLSLSNYRYITLPS